MTHPITVSTSRYMIVPVDTPWPNSNSRTSGGVVTAAYNA